MQALERLSFGGSRIRDTVIAQSRILLFWYFTTYLLLEKNKPKYQRLEPPPINDEGQPQVLVEPSDIDQVNPEKQLDPLPDEAEQEKQQIESPALDQLPPFVLEGL